MPQTYFLKSRIYNDFPLDYIGRYEQLYKDFEIICKKLNINSSLKYLNSTSTNRPNYYKHYTNKMINVIGETYEDDVNLLNYDFYEY